MTCPARRWYCPAALRSMPRWCNCTWAWVQASAAARSNAPASWCLSTRSRTSSREEATMVQKSTRAVAPGAILTRRRRAKIGSSTVPVAPESGRPLTAAVGARMLPPRPRNRARSVSNSRLPTAWPIDDRQVRGPDLRLGRRPPPPRRQDRAQIRRGARSRRTVWRTPDAQRRRPEAPSTNSA